MKMQHEQHEDNDKMKIQKKHETKKRREHDHQKQRKFFLRIGNDMALACATSTLDAMRLKPWIDWSGFSFFDSSIFWLAGVYQLTFFVSFAFLFLFFFVSSLRVLGIATLSTSLPSRYRYPFYSIPTSSRLSLTKLYSFLFTLSYTFLIHFEPP